MPSSLMETIPPSDKTIGYSEAEERHFDCWEAVHCSPAVVSTTYWSVRSHWRLPARSVLNIMDCQIDF